MDEESLAEIEQKIYSLMKAVEYLDKAKGFGNAKLDKLTEKVKKQAVFVRRVCAQLFVAEDAIPKLKW